MTPRAILRLPVLGLAATIGVAAIHPAAAQDVSLNYESLSSLEEPLATEIGDVTLVLTGLLDASLTHASEDETEVDSGFIGNVQLAALTQLPNSWRLALTYFGQYANDAATGFRSHENFVDNGAVSIGSAWGTVLGGDISGVVREQTRRLRGAGNGVLAFDEALGTLEDPGGGYLGRFGPWVVGVVVDRNGNLDLGAIYQRPGGNKDYRFAVRATDGTYGAADGSEHFSTTAASVVGEVIYGSTAFDAGVGYERFRAHARQPERWYVSAGIHTKSGVVSLSAEGHFGRIEGQDEVSAALGFQYDLARGLSANLGINYAKAEIMSGGATFMHVDDTETTLSVRYSF